MNGAHIRKNVDILACMPRYESSWTFFVPGHATRISEEVDDILDVTKKLLSCMDAFFLPESINYIVLTYPNDNSINNVLDYKHSRVMEGNVRSDCGHILENLREDVDEKIARENGFKRISLINIEGKTRFVLLGKEVYIGKSIGEDSYAYFGYDGVLEQGAGKPNVNPLRLQINHGFAKSEKETVSDGEPAFYKIIIWTETDIWFEPTDLGKANRDALRRVIKKIYANFDVSGTYFSSSRFSREDLDEVAF